VLTTKCVTAGKQKRTPRVTDQPAQQHFPAWRVSALEQDMDTATQWALLLGALTLASWIAGGLTAVFGNVEPGHPRQKAAEYLMFGLNAAGLASAVAMVAILVIR
jgi:hypothetical protein